LAGSRLRPAKSAAAPARRVFPETVCLVATSYAATRRDFVRGLIMHMPALSSPVAPSRRSLFVSALAAAGLLSLVGCSTQRPPRHARAEAPQPPLAARAEFFAGTLLAETRVTSFRSSLGAPSPDREGSGRHSDRGGPPPGGGGGMGPPHGGGMGGPPPGGGERGGRGDSASPRNSGGRGGFAALPRQMLRVSFTNHSTTELSLTVTELNSAIGNFVPQPEKLTIPAGGTASLEPVSGDAGGNLEWLDVTLALRRSGQLEKQILHLVATGEPAEEPTPPPPPGKR
jgi:hypothetical protein